jgi:hypothetical protein
VEPLEPLQANDDFKLMVRFSRPTYWCLVWFDTAGIVSVADQAARRTDSIDYPAVEKFMPVNPVDPEGKHWLALIAGDHVVDSAQLEQRLAELARSADRVEAGVFERGAGNPRESEAMLPHTFLTEISRKLPDRLAAVQLIPLQTAK